jgi:ribosomal protein S12 methylthiotransferase accessory factor
MEFDATERPIPGEYHRLLGSRTGIVSELAVIAPSRHEPQVHVGTTTQADPGVLRGEDPEEMDTGGKALDPDAALQGAIGETCERYAYYWPDESAIEEATHAELADRARVVAFDYLTPHGQDRPDAETPLEPFDRTTELRWTTGTDLLTGEEVYVPAARVWYRRGPLADTPVRFVMTSNGTGAGERMADALLAGIQEVVERDAFMTTWCTERTPPGVDLGAFPRLERITDELLPAAHHSAHLFEFEGHTDFVTLGAAIVDERDRFPKFAIGGGAALDVETAAVDALTEAGQGWPYLKQLVMNRDPADLGVDDVITNLDDNVMLYGKPDAFEHVSFLLDGEPMVPDPPSIDASDELAAALELFERADCTPVAVDITPPDVDEVGIHVAKLVVPELVPFSMPSMPPAHHPKLAGVDVNRDPHPYP